jgi:hypothetical protein
MWRSNGGTPPDPADDARSGHALKDVSAIEEAQLSAQDVLLLQACLRFVLKHQQDPGVRARLQQLADTLARVGERI